MIVFDIECSDGHRFEGWFANAAAFDKQRDDKRIACPWCGATKVERVLSVPRIGTSTGSQSLGPTHAAMFARLAAMQQSMLAKSTWVGRNFADRARAMADGAEEQATIHGQATVDEAQALHDDGIPVMPLLVPIVPPESRN